VRSYNRAHPSIGPLGEREPLCPPNLVPLVVSDISQATQNNPESAARPDDIGAWDATNAGLFYDLSRRREIPMQQVAPPMRRKEISLPLVVYVTTTC
jgi:hypothetical protein